jgi:hypothetical protein
MRVNKDLDKIYFDPVAKYKETHGFDPEMSIDDQMIRWYDSWQSPPLARWFTPQDIKFIEDVAVSPTLTTHPIEKYHLLDEFMESRGFKTEIGGTNRRFYSSVEFPQFGAKISTSLEGFKNNKDEFNVQHVLKPYCTKVYDVTQSGAIALDEVGLRIDKDSIIDYGDQIFDILDIVFRRRKIAMTDVGIATPKQWVIRRNFGPILCDFPSVVILDPKKCYCTRRVKRHGIEMPCNGLIDFDLGFNKMECTVCGQKYEIKSLMATNTPTTINRTYVKGESRKGELSNMAIEIIFDTDDVIVDGVSQKTKKKVLVDRSSSFVDMEHAPAPKAAPISAPVITSDDSTDSFVESMARLTEFATNPNSFTSSSGLDVMAEDDEVEDKKEEEVVDVETNETPVEHVEAEIVDESVVPDDTAILNSYSATAEVLAANYKGDLDYLNEDEDDEDTDADYITRDEFDRFASSIYNKINDLDEKIEKIANDLKNLGDEYATDANKINENFMAVEVDFKSMKETVASLYQGMPDKKSLIIDIVDKVVPAFMKMIPELVKEQLQGTKGESEKNDSEHIEIEENDDAKKIYEESVKNNETPWWMYTVDTTPRPKKAYTSSTMTPDNSTPPLRAREEGEDWGDEEEEQPISVSTSSVITDYYDPEKAARAKKYEQKRNKKRRKDNNYNKRKN